MRFIDYLKDKLFFVVIAAALLGFLSLCFNLLKINLYSTLYLLTTIFLAFALIFFTEYFIKAHYYNDVKKKLEHLDKKFLLSELIDPPILKECHIVYDIVKSTSKSMNDEIAIYRINSEEYREYIETWVHEIKTPIASAKLLIENHQTPMTLSISEEIDHIESYVTQALFYSRSNNVEKDYTIRKIKLENLVNPILRRNAQTFIHQKIGIKLDNLGLTVFTDPKWTDFIIGQVLDNALKYIKIDGPEPPIICIEGKAEKAEVTLTICDNGVGIPTKDLGRVFEKGFTGTNGRKSGSKATGIGLYLCKKLCHKLGLGLTLSSSDRKGTAVVIHFPI